MAALALPSPRSSSRATFPAHAASYPRSSPSAVASPRSLRPLHFSYTLLYSLAASAALAGLTFGAFARRLQRAALLWWSAAGATASAGLFAGTHRVALTMLGAAVLGFAALPCSPAPRRSCPTGTAYAATAR